MKQTIAAGRALATLLERENAALAAMDLAGAAALYPAKDAAAAALAAAQREAGEAMRPALDAEQHRLAHELAERLRVLAEENRRLLERAIQVQGQVLGTIARAVAMSAPRAQPPRYGATGAFSHARRQAPVVLSARA
jgi:flagellar biosynthesis/type III secretory pathway chaperone